MKYHESLGDAPAPHRERYDVVAKQMGCFHPGAYEKLKAKPLQQIWRDHLLVGALRADEAEGYADAFFAFAYPADNDRCSKAVASYRSCLASASTFVPWTLEEIVAAAKAEGAGDWIDAFEQRYLQFDKIASLV